MKKQITQLLLVVAGIIFLNTLSNAQCPIVIAGRDQIVCATQTSISLDGKIDGKVNQYGWISTSGGATPMNLTGTYILSSTDINNGSVKLILSAFPANFPTCSMVSDTILITISKVPTANAGPNITVCKTSLAEIKYATATKGAALKWTSSGTGLFGIDDVLLANYGPSAADDANGKVILTLTATNYPCPSASDTATVFFQVCTGTNEATAQNAIQVSPNPSTGAISITVPENMNNNSSTLEVINPMGGVIIKQAYTSSLDLSNINAGVYYLKVSNNENSLTKKIVIE